MKIGTNIYVHELDQVVTVQSLTVEGKPETVRVIQHDSNGTPYADIVNIVEKGYRWTRWIGTILSIVLRLLGKPVGPVPGTIDLTRKF